MSAPRLTLVKHPKNWNCPQRLICKTLKNVVFFLLFFSRPYWIFHQIRNINHFIVTLAQCVIDVSKQLKAESK